MQLTDAISTGTMSHSATDSTSHFFPIFKFLMLYLKPLFGLEAVDNVQVKGMDEVGIVIAFQLAL
jgi:hypothetical protein